MKKIISIFLLLNIISCKVRIEKSHQLPSELLMTNILIEGYNPKKVNLSTRVAISQEIFIDTVLPKYEYYFIKDVFKDFTLTQGKIYQKNETTPFLFKYFYRKNIYDPYNTVEIFYNKMYYQNKDKFKNLEVLIDSVRNVVPEKELPTIISDLEKPICVKKYFFDDCFNLNGEFRAYNYTTYFEKGAGYWKDFYDKNRLKEEGEVKNNLNAGHAKIYPLDNHYLFISPYLVGDVDKRSLVITHEIGHTLGLDHSSEMSSYFLNKKMIEKSVEKLENVSYNGRTYTREQYIKVKLKELEKVVPKFLFNYSTNDNIMEKDNNISQKSFWRWQWLKMQEELNLYYNEK